MTWRECAGRSSARRGPIRAAIAAMAMTVALSACASSAPSDVYDPWEPLNRTVFGLNELVDLMVIEPASIVYGHLPSPVRTGVRNVLNNLKEPVTFMNAGLQGNGETAGTALGRFMINTLVGMGGLFDLASEFGYERRVEDFGQTLGHWGVGPGPFLMLPLLGPSTVRDTAGMGVDFLATQPLPPNLGTEASIAVRAVDGVDTRERLTPVINDVRANSLDPYATFRSAYLQRRAAEIRNGSATGDDAAYEEIFNEPDPATEE